ncbi:MAG: hypothetical protein JHC33_08560 [Ignisphaera sp.]|nr:hypothetical protein [Ignisphaera sp.]
MLTFNEEEAKSTITPSIMVFIDADSLIYRACHVGEKSYKSVVIKNDNPMYHEDLLMSQFEEQKDIFHGMINSILDSINIDLHKEGKAILDYRLLFTPKSNYCKANGLKHNFRYDLIDEFNKTYNQAVPGYKASRAGMALPEGISEMFDYATTLPNSLFSDGCEADDLIVHLKKLDPENNIIACLDKDIYLGCEGTHYNFNKREWVTTSKEDAELFVHRQALMGDSSDGIVGIKGMGPKTAEKVLPKWTDHLWKDTLAIFLKHGYSKEYAVLQFQLVYMHHIDENGIFNLWQPTPDTNETN